MLVTIREGSFVCCSIYAPWLVWRVQKNILFTVVMKNELSVICLGHQWGIKSIVSTQSKESSWEDFHHRAVITQRKVCWFYCILLSFFFFCVPSYISGVHHFWWGFCVCDHFFLIQPLRWSHSIFMDGACWVYLGCRHSSVWARNIRIFWARVALR